MSPNALAVHYNAANGSLVVHLTSKTDEAIECLEGDKCQMEDSNIIEPARIKDRSVDEHVFDRTFGHNERMQSIIGTPGIFVQKQGHKSYIPFCGHLFFANYFLTSLNASFKNMTQMSTNLSIPWVNQAVTRVQRKYYKELSLEYVPADGQKL